MQKSLSVLLLLAACGGPKSSGTGVAELGGFAESMHGAAVRDSLRQFADSVAAGITREGPAAWRKYFSRDAEFFMSVDGQIALPSGDSAFKAIDGLVKAITRMTLRWDGPVRVDAVAPGLGVLTMRYAETRVDPAGQSVDETGMFTGLAEHRPDGWRFRNVQWNTDTR